MATALSARRTCSASRSHSENTATVPSPISRHARMTRTAISPRLAIRTFITPRASQRNVAVFLRRVAVALVGAARERRNQLPARGAGLGDLVDQAPGGGEVGVRVVVRAN